MSALRLDLIVRRYYNNVPGEPAWEPRWTWRLWSGSRIVSTSGSQRYSRRIDCARGAEVGAGLVGVAEAVKGPSNRYAARWEASNTYTDVEVRLVDDRGAGSAS